MSCDVADQGRGAGQHPGVGRLGQRGAVEGQRRDARADPPAVSTASPDRHDGPAGPAQHQQGHRGGPEQRPEQPVHGHEDHRAVRRSRADVVAEPLEHAGSSTIGGRPRRRGAAVTRTVSAERPVVAVHRSACPAGAARTSVSPCRATARARRGRRRGRSGGRPGRRRTRPEPGPAERAEHARRASARRSGPAGGPDGGAGAGAAGGGRRSSRAHQPSSSRRSSSMPKWCATSCTTVVRTSSTSSASLRAGPQQVGAEERDPVRQHAGVVPAPLGQRDPLVQAEQVRRRGRSPRPRRRRCASARRARAGARRGPRVTSASKRSSLMVTTPSSLPCLRPCGAPEGPASLSGPASHLPPGSRPRRRSNGRSLSWAP